MIKRWLTLDTVIDNYIDDIGSYAEGEGKLKIIERQCKRAAYNLYSLCQATLEPEEITGTVNNNIIELPDGYCKFKALWVDGQEVLVSTPQRHLRNNKNTTNNSVYKAKIVGEAIMFRVTGGDYNLKGKSYSLEYETVPLNDGILYVPQEFEEAIHDKLRLNMMKVKVEKNGRGEGLLKTYKKFADDSEQNAIVLVEFPSWDELIQIGNYWESKIPISLQNQFNNNI